MLKFRPLGDKTKALVGELGAVVSVVVDNSVLVTVTGNAVVVETEFSVVVDTRVVVSVTGSAVAVETEVITRSLALPKRYPAPAPTKTAIANATAIALPFIE
jgi:hypothetical protein